MSARLTSAEWADAVIRRSKHMWRFGFPARYIDPDPIYGARAKRAAGYGVSGTPYSVWAEIESERTACRPQP